MYVNQTYTNNSHLHAHHEIHEDDPTRTFRLATFFVSIPICIVAVLIDLLLIFIVLKYRAFKTRGNYYILNFCVCNIVFLTAEHALHLSMDLFFGGRLDVHWYCTFIQLENYFLQMCILFVTGHVLDEYVIMISSEYFLYMYKNGFKYIISSIYPIHVILAFLVSNVCFSSIRDIKFHISFIFVTIVYAICLAIVIKIRIDCRKNNFKGNKCLLQALEVVLFTILFFLPVIFYYNMLSIVEKIIVDDNLNILRSIAFVSEYLAYSATFALAYKLFKVNKFYRLAFCKIIRKKGDLDFSRLDIVPEADIDKQ